MIPAEYGYSRPSSKREALEMLANGGAEARPLAGGHSIIPMMKLRMAAPSTLVDIGGLDELRGITIDDDVIEIGATTTQHELINSAPLFDACPIIRETAEMIADPQVRYCGTLGGNVGNGDPGNDMPALMQCLGASYVVENVDGAREVPARDFYQAAYFTALAQGELLTKIRFPRPASNHGYAYCKLKRKIGDYATAAAAVVLEISGGSVRDASIALTNVADTPLYAEEAANKLKGAPLSEAAISAAVVHAEAITAPSADGRGSAEYRTKMAGVMVRRAIALASNRAGEAGPAPKPLPTASGEPQKKGGFLGWLKS